MFQATKCYKCSMKAGDKDDSCLKAQEKAPVVDCGGRSCAVYQETRKDNGKFYRLLRGCESQVSLYPDFEGFEPSEMCNGFYHFCQQDLCNKVRNCYSCLMKAGDKDDTCLKAPEKARIESCWQCTAIRQQYYFSSSSNVLLLHHKCYSALCNAVPVLNACNSNMYIGGMIIVKDCTDKEEDYPFDPFGSGEHLELPGAGSSVVLNTVMSLIAKEVLCLLFVFNI